MNTGRIHAQIQKTGTRVTHGGDHGFIKKTKYRMRRHFGLKDYGPALEGGILAHLCGTPSDFPPGKANARPDSATRMAPGW